MRTRKETIADVLKSGTNETFTITNQCNVKENVIRSTNRCGKYEYPAGWEEELLKRERKFSRREKEVREYGAGGKKFFNRIPKTQEILAKLQDSKEECRIYHALYQQSLQAPRHLQEYVFHNLTEWMKIHGCKFHAGCSWFAAAILPPAWKEGWEKVDLFGWDTEYQLHDLLPAAGVEIGTEVMIRHKYYDPIDGHIVGYKYKYEQEKKSLRRGSYGFLVEEMAGRYILVYDVKYGEKNYEHCTFRLDELSVAHAVAS